MGVGSRVVIVVLSIIALNTVLGLVDERIPRMLLGALMMGFLTWAAFTAARPPAATAGRPSGVGERRKSHALRHRVDEFLKNVRRLHAIAQDAREGHVSRELADKALAEIERQLEELLKQIEDLAGRAA